MTSDAPLLVENEVMTASSLEKNTRYSSTIPCLDWLARPRPSVPSDRVTKDHCGSYFHAWARSSSTWQTEIVQG